MVSGLANKPILELARHLPEPSCERLPGSYGHPDLCHRPCVHMQRSGSCLAGESCGYCHERHHRQPHKLPKPIRSMLREMPRARAMDLLLPHIHHRVAQHQLLPEAQELLQSLERERCSEPQSTHLDANSTDLQQLNMQLSRLSLLVLAPGSSHKNLSVGFCDCEVRIKQVQVVTLSNIKRQDWL